jgi:hypothetical protein
MSKKPIPWGWLILGFLGYGIVGFALLAVGNFFTLPLGAELVLSLSLAALLALVLTFSATIGTGLLVLLAIGFSASVIFCAAYLWNFVLYFWSNSLLRIVYLVGLGVGLGTVWAGVRGLLGARNELIKVCRKLRTFWILAATSVGGLGLGWLVGYLVFY